MTTADATDDLAAHLAGLPPARVLYTDLDGTLLGPGGSLLTAPDGTPSAAAAQALVAAAAAGVAVVPVSGREHWQLQQDARLLGLASCIAEAGGVVVRDGVLTHVWGDAPRDLGPHPTAALEASGALAAVLAAFDGDLRPYEPWCRGREGGMLLHGVADVDRADRVLADAGCGWAHLVDNGATGGWPGRVVRAYHLLPRGVGKVRAVADDLAARGLRPEEAVALGDSPADARMAEVVGTYVQVANGHADGTAPNRFVAAGAMGDGVAEVIAVVLARVRPTSDSAGS